MAFWDTLQRMRKGLTVAASVRPFAAGCAEPTNFPSEVAEMSLAHSVCTKVEAAYRRGDMFDKRRQLMDAWAVFCSQPSV
jgi:hypothetical protein